MQPFFVLDVRGHTRLLTPLVALSATSTELVRGFLLCGSGGDAMFLVES